MTDFWTPANVAETIRRWNEGECARQIAEAIGAASRSAVCGKIHRLRRTGVALRVEEQGKARSHSIRNGLRTANPATAKTARPPRPRQNNLAGANVARRLASEALPLPPEPSLVDATHAKPWLLRQFGECSWLIGEPTADALCCGAPVHKRGWCAGHYRVGTIPTKPPTDKEVAWAQRRWAA